MFFLIPNNSLSLFLDELINYDLDEVTPHNLAAKISRISTYSKLLLALNDSVIVPPAAKTFGKSPSQMPTRFLIRASPFKWNRENCSHKR